MLSNPFTLSFGEEPSQYISRHQQINEIIDSFSGDTPTAHVYMISGVRGSGKTVMLADISDSFSQKKDWIVISVTPDSDILHSIAAKLYSIPELKKLFTSAKLDLSAFGLGVHIDTANQIFDIDTAIEKMLEQIKKKGRKVLITIDEIVKNDSVKYFAGVFQILVRQKLPVFLLMTGLYDNIYNLQNEKTLTFLYRAPKIALEPLSLNAISRSYESVLKVDRVKADQMAKLTCGYAFAYQVLGYIYWNKFIKKKSSGTIEDLISEYDGLLEEYVYEKLWFELSPKEKDIIAIISERGTVKVEEIRDTLSMTSGNMAVYRDRLIKKGLVDGSRYGYLSLKLPRFGDIIRIWI
ncbi:MAG: ATP-binding protein [Lachnospiraceae bacterium]|nr:ATP-binding protein [Lachnospiraceae bacterium]